MEMLFLTQDREIRENLLNWTLLGSLGQHMDVFVLHQSPKVREDTSEPDSSVLAAWLHIVSALVAEVGAALRHALVTVVAGR